MDYNELFKVILLLWVIGFMLSTTKHYSLYLNLSPWLKRVLFIKSSPCKVCIVAVVWQGLLYLMSFSLVITKIFFEDIFNKYCLILDNFFLAFLSIIVIIGIVDAVITDRNNNCFLRRSSIKKYDYFIVTDELILARFGNKDWQEFEFKKYYNHDILKKHVDIFEDRESFLKVIKAIHKVTGNSFLSRVFGEKKDALVLYGFSDNSESRISLIDNFLYFNMYYSTITNCEVGLATAAISEVNENYLPLIIVSIIGNYTEFSFCFAGTTIINRYCKGVFQNEFDDFYMECIKVREEDLSKYFISSKLNIDILEGLKKTWNNSTDFKIIKASNSILSDQVICNSNIFDSYVNFTEVTDAMPRLFEVTFTGKKGIVL